MVGKIFGFLLIVFVLLLGGIFIKASQQARNPAATVTPTPVPVVSVKPTSSPSASPHASSTPAVSPSVSPIVKTRLVSIDVDNDAAGLTSFHAPKGMRVRLTINVMSTNVDMQGLRFKSNVIDTGVILPGASKTVEFIADQPFTLTPFAVSNGTVRPYSIQFVLE